MNQNRISWLLYGVGLAVVLASWVNLVPRQVGWAGWFVCMVGWVIRPGRWRR